jgi:hypothetical protein
MTLRCLTARGRLPLVAVAACVCAAASVGSVGSVAAQRPGAEPADGTAGQSISELERLREAGRLEAAGDLGAAERMVRDVLEANAASLTGLVALERLLTAQGRGPDVLPAVERLLREDPRSVMGHQMRLRVLAQRGSVPALESAIAAWTRATPAVETPWREAALVWRARGEHRRAIAILEAGRREIERPDALALELGDAHTAAGDVRRAAGEWARAIGNDGRGFMLVQRRLQEQVDGGARALPVLIEQLGTAPHTIGRLRAATLLAIEARLDEAARRHAATLATAVEPAERETLLAELARRSDHAGMHGLAGWAYGELLRHARDPAATLALRTRVAELALLAGDTARAAEVFGELEVAAAAGSPQRRQAVALRIQLAAREGDLARAAAELNGFRSEFPGAPEVDAAAALVAEGYLVAGDAASAGRVLTGVSGARSAQLRGRIALLAGDLPTAREELLAAASQLHGAEATETLALAALLMRLTPRGGELAAVYIGADEAAREESLRRAVELTRPLAATERAALLEFLAGLADRSRLVDDADALRRELVDALPRARESAGALLALARRAAAEPEGAEEARVLLERLILEHPRSTLAPQARQELQRLRGRAPSP